MSTAREWLPAAVAMAHPPPSATDSNRCTGDADPDGTFGVTGTTGVWVPPADVLDAVAVGVGVGVGACALVLCAPLASSTKRIGISGRLRCARIMSAPQALQSGSSYGGTEFDVNYWHQHARHRRQRFRPADTGADAACIRHPLRRQRGGERAPAGSRTSARSR